MFSNHLFWLAIGLLSWSGFCLNASFSVFNGAKDTMRNIVQWVGIAGMIAGIIRTIMLCIHFDWWWLLGIVIGFFVVIGALSALIRGSIAVIFSCIGLIGIPVIWWIGGIF